MSTQILTVSGSGSGTIVLHVADETIDSQIEALTIRMAAGGLATQISTLRLVDHVDDLDLTTPTVPGAEYVRQTLTTINLDGSDTAASYGPTHYTPPIKFSRGAAYVLDVTATGAYTLHFGLVTGDWRRRRDARVL